MGVRGKGRGTTLFKGFPSPLPPAVTIGNAAPHEVRLLEEQENAKRFGRHGGLFIPR